MVILNINSRKTVLFPIFDESCLILFLTAAAQVRRTAINVV